MRFNPFRRAAFRFWRTALPLVLMPAAELALLLYFFGILFTLLNVLIGGLFGAFLARRQGVRCWMEFNRQLDHGETPTVPVLSGVLILLAVLLLILPGFLSGLAGLVLLFPPTRAFVISYLVLYFEAHRLQKRKREAPSAPEVIDI